MFIFSFLFRLIEMALGLVFSLLFLPFRLLGIPLALVLLPIRIVLKAILSHPVFAVFLVMFGVLFFSFRHNNSSVPELTPAPAATGTVTPGAGAKFLAQPVRTREDGNSDFATDLYATMTDEERAYYSYVFYWALNTLIDGQASNWTHGNIQGTLKVTSSFTNNSGTRCRTFNEVLKVHTIEQSLNGMACDQGNATWCKLKATSTPMCGLGGSGGGLLNSLPRSIRNLF